MALTSREFQYLCIWCFLVTQDILLHFCPFTIKPGQTIFSACAIITSSGTIEINTAVDITCINQPYTGTHIWKFNTAEVLICGFTNCVENASNPTRFSFVNDRGNGVFVFTINPVTRLDDETIIGCHNGSVEDTLKLEVKDSDGNQRKQNYGLIIGVPVAVFVVIIKVIILCCCCGCCAHKPDPPKDFTFNGNINSYELPYVSWVPGFNRGYPQTFILQFKTSNQTNTRRGKPISYKEKEHDSKTLDVESNKMFSITSHNEKTIRRQIKGLEPLSQYKIKLYGKNKYRKSEVKTLHENTHGKPDPPKEIQINENKNGDGITYMSWVPGFNGGCLQCFFIRFEIIARLPETKIETLKQTDIEEGTIKTFTEGHPVTLDMKLDNKFTITTHKETKEILLLIENLEPPYKIVLCGVNKYGKSEDVEHKSNEATGSSFNPGHFNQPNHNKKSLPPLKNQPTSRSKHLAAKH